MSKNKNIKLLHDMTDLSYKECRSLMKKHHWDLWIAYLEAKGLPQCASLLEFADDIGKNLARICNALGEAVSEVANSIVNATNALLSAKENEV